MRITSLEANPSSYSIKMKWFFFREQVTWRRDGEIPPLTIGLFTFVADSRIAVDFNQVNTFLVLKPPMLYSYIA